MIGKIWVGDFLFWNGDCLGEFCAREFKVHPRNTSNGQHCPYQTNCAMRKFIQTRPTSTWSIFWVQDQDFSHLQGSCFPSTKKNTRFAIGLFILRYTPFWNIEFFVRFLDGFFHAIFVQFLTSRICALPCYPNIRENCNIKTTRGSEKWCLRCAMNKKYISENIRPEMINFNINKRDKNVLLVTLDSHKPKINQEYWVFGCDVVCLSQLSDLYYFLYLWQNHGMCFANTRIWLFSKQKGVNL